MLLRSIWGSATSLCMDYILNCIICLFILREAVVWSFSVKVFLKGIAKFIGKHLPWWPATLLKKYPLQVFSYEFFTIFKTPILKNTYEQLFLP